MPPETTPKAFTKNDLIEAGSEMSELLSHRRNPSKEDGERITELNDRFGHVPAIEHILKDDYDRKMTHKGFGAPDCFCHIAPPCGA
jgi:hypothetical protein